MALGGTFTLIGYTLATLNNEVTAQSETTVVDEIVCRKLRVVDAQDRTVAVLATDDIYDVLSIYSKQGHKVKSFLSAIAYGLGGVALATDSDGGAIVGSIGFLAGTIGLVVYRAHPVIFSPEGNALVECTVNLKAYEAITRELMWAKRIPITSGMVHPRSVQRTIPTSLTFQTLLEIDNRFYSDVGKALEEQYDEVMKKIYDYLDPREMAIVKRQALELRATARKVW